MEVTVENMLMTEEQLREQNRILTSLVGDLAVILDGVLAALPPPFREVENVRRSIDLTQKIIAMMNATTREPHPSQPVALPPAADYMGGRWRRRDGDVYGIVRQPGVRLTPETENDADDPPGNLRSPYQR